MVQFEIVKALVTYLKEVQLEISKVVWPKREEIVKLTLIVLLISGIVGFYVGGLDYAFTKLLEYFISL